MKRFVVIFLCLILLTGCSQKPSPEDEFAESLKPYLDSIISDVGKSSPLSDLSFLIRIDELQSDKSADGEIVFVSDELASYSPEEQYAITQEISRMVFLKLNGGEESLFMLKLGERYLSLHHGTGFSCWQTNSGTEYISSYYDLKQDGVQIYDNPVNDLEADLEAELGMPYAEWIKKRNMDSEGNAVASSDKNFWPAVTAAQSLVKDELKAPSTARFPVSADSYAVIFDGQTWKVSGYVDAQNSFGATIRENWTATFAMGDTSGAEYKVSNYRVSFD